jgi:hypothetical protein
MLGPRRQLFVVGVTNDSPGWVHARPGLTIFCHMSLVSRGDYRGMVCKKSVREHKHFYRKTGGYSNPKATKTTLGLHINLIQLLLEFLQGQIPAKRFVVYGENILGWIHAPSIEHGFWRELFSDRWICLRIGRPPVERSRRYLEKIRDLFRSEKFLFKYSDH